MTRHPHSLSHQKLPKSNARASLETARLVRLGRWKCGLCYFHANPDKAAELERNGGRHRKQTYEQATEHIAPPESAADVRRMLAETTAEVKAGRMDPKVANTVAYVGTVLLRAYETDSSPAADSPAQPCVPLIYR